MLWSFYAAIPMSYFSRPIIAWYSGINPYALGFAMFEGYQTYLSRSPTDEDKYWFPDIARFRLTEALHFAMRDFKDESFIKPVPVAKSDA